jgi:hypothetical protein
LPTGKNSVIPMLLICATNCASHSCKASKRFRSSADGLANLFECLQRRLTDLTECLDDIILACQSYSLNNVW